jgi:hypothetical protein
MRVEGVGRTSDRCRAGENTLNDFNDFHTGNGLSQSRNLALTVLFVPNSQWPSHDLHCFIFFIAKSRTRRRGTSDFDEKAVDVARGPSARRGSTSKGLRPFYLKAKARIWPLLSYMCRNLAFTVLSARIWPRLSCLCQNLALTVSCTP